MLIALGAAFFVSIGTLEQPTAEPIVLRDAHVIAPGGRSGRSAVRIDPLEAEVVAGRWPRPDADTPLKGPDGRERAWEPAATGEDGWLSHRALVGGYAAWTVTSPEDRIVILDASGHSMVYANGEPRTGDPYQLGTVRLPVLLRAGDNDFLFSCGRGRLRARLETPRSEAMIDLKDTTLPDLLDDGGSDPLLAGIVIVNASADWLGDARIIASAPGGELLESEVPAIPPLGVRKAPVRLPRPAIVTRESVEYTLTLRRGGSVTDTATIALTVRKPDQTHKRTFISGIDGSVQYFSVVPARRAEAAKEPPAMVLTLHGASVEATNQAGAYRAKDWCTIVAPTNRRPFGFDWEDWGRLDAMEVLNLAQELFPFDPQRVYLTGHSMGGHGTWQVGAQFPGRFAAIGPSAGWVSFWSYTGADSYDDPDAVEAILKRATSPSDTMALSDNYADHGVYILHGDADDNVPVGQARTMRERLGRFHTNFAYYERPGAGHWWGDACVDWAPMFEFFRANRKPLARDVRRVRFTTAHPGVSATRDWATIEAQAEPFAFSSIDLRLDEGRRTFSGTTSNVERLSIDLSVLAEPFETPASGQPAIRRSLEPGAPIMVELDGQTLENIPWPSEGDRLWLERAGEVWSISERPDGLHKHPGRAGPLKDAFRNRVLFVYGTAGDDAEDASNLAKARFDAETFWYRGNGSINIVPDTAFDPADDPDRSVILYGNADTNSAWSVLLSGAPIEVRRGRVTIGDSSYARDDLACLFVYPRPGSETASIGVVAGSGPLGDRIAWRTPYFVSGVGFPDVTLIGPEMLTAGSDGVLAAGFFGNDWSIESGDFAFRAAP